MNKSFKVLFVVLFLISTINISAQHTYECPVCHGKKTIPAVCTNPECHNGVVYCEKCDYSGTINQRCDACEGTGVIAKVKDLPCPVCKGEKGFIKEKHEPCDKCGGRNGKVPTMQNGQKVYIDCKFCKGKGYTVTKYKAARRTCGGTGKKGQETYYEKCNICQGSGSVTKTCEQCDGKGCFVCPTCQGYGNISITCERCHGEGVIHTAN